MTFRQTVPHNPTALPLAEACAREGHGRDKGLQKIKAGRWRSYVDGGQRMVLVESIDADRARMLAEAAGQFVPQPYRGQTPAARTLKPQPA
jgi:hypothetical protein